MHILCTKLTLCLMTILFMNACVDARNKFGSHHHYNGRSHHQPHQHCISQEDLNKKGDLAMQPFFKKNMDFRRDPAVQMVQRFEGKQKKSCPNLQSSTSIDNDGINERSISPWSYRISYDENRYPQKLAFAECLCRGCISTHSGKEIFSVNSVEVYQTMMVLRRRPCPTNPQTFTFEVDYETVPVGCTCALPKY